MWLADTDRPRKKKRPMPAEALGGTVGRTNWGRWGSDDQRGSLNLLTPERVLSALARPRQGSTFSLGTQIGKRGVITSGRNQTWHVTTSVEDPTTPGNGRAEDVVMMHTHAHTHIDGLGHSWFDGKLYNGVDARQAVGRGGSNHGAVDKYGPIVGTAMLLDLTQGRKPFEPGEIVTADALERAAGRADVSGEETDVLLIRVGWTEVFFADRARFESGAPGLGPDATEWVAAQDVAVVGMDCAAFEPMPPPPGVHPLAVHRRFLHDLGTPMMESLDLSAPAAAGVTSGLFVATPLQIQRGLGSPLNPVLVV